jgi:hypothetical protein
MGPRYLNADLAETKDGSFLVQLEQKNSIPASPSTGSPHFAQYGGSTGSSAARHSQQTCPVSSRIGFPHAPQQRG